MLAFSAKWPLLFVCGILTIAAGGFASPAYLTIATALLPAAKQGQLAGAVTAIALCSVGFGVIVYSVIFAAVSSESIIAIPFFVGAIPMTAAFLAAWRFTKQFEAHEIASSAASADDTPEEITAAMEVGEVELAPRK